MSNLTVLFLFAIGLHAPSPNSSQMTLGDLQRLCLASDAPSRAGCHFYVLGVSEGAELSSLERDDFRRFCVPAGISSQQVQSAVIAAMGKLLIAFPRDVNLPAASFVGAVMRKNYPCPKGR